MSKKWVYLFTEGNKDMRDLLGGKGAGVAEMTNTGVPVPPGFTITTEACNEYFKIDKQFPEDLWNQALAALAVIQEKTGKRFGDAENPLLVSVRSGAKFSMPGMMDTVLNVGLNPQTLEALGPEGLASRVRREYAALPGLRLTAAQVHRMWALDDSQARQLLDHLVRTGFLVDLGEGVFMRRDIAPGPVDSPDEAPLFD